jgi:hypothetical protein
MHEVLAAASAAHGLLVVLDIPAIAAMLEQELSLT